MAELNVQDIVKNLSENKKTGEATAKAMASEITNKTGSHSNKFTETLKNLATPYGSDGKMFGMDPNKFYFGEDEKFLGMENTPDLSANSWMEQGKEIYTAVKEGVLGEGVQRIGNLGNTYEVVKTELQQELENLSPEQKDGIQWEYGTHGEKYINQPISPAFDEQLIPFIKSSHNEWGSAGSNMFGLSGLQINKTDNGYTVTIENRGTTMLGMVPGLGDWIAPDWEDMPIRADENGRPYFEQFGDFGGSSKIYLDDAWKKEGFVNPAKYMESKLGFWK